MRAGILMDRISMMDIGSCMFMAKMWSYIEVDNQDDPDNKAYILVYDCFNRTVPVESATEEALAEYEAECEETFLLNCQRHKDGMIVTDEYLSLSLEPWNTSTTIGEMTEHIKFRNGG